MSDEDEEVIGYKRPPKRSQFKPGVSGNPTGRPKKRRTLDEAVAIAGQRRVRITIEGEEESVSLFDAVAVRALSDAARGDPKARQFVERVEERIAREEAERHQRDPLGLGVNISSWE